MVDIITCPVCSGAKFSPSHSCIDTTVSREIFSIKICEACELGITSPRPDDNQLGNYYLSEKYISHTGKSPGITGTLYQIARKFTLQWKRSLVEKYIKPGMILDYGCGTGDFLRVMKNKKWQITGVEPSAAAREKAAANTGQTILSNLAGVSGNVDVITLWHVLEHIPDLNETLSSFHKILQKKGVLLIAVPNYLSYDAIHYKGFWAGFDVPRHLWHFTNKNMDQLLRKNGYTLKATVPMKLDAYYVSLLSEKNKNASTISQLLNAFIVASRSNTKAHKATNYSSVIYIANPV